MSNVITINNSALVTLGSKTITSLDDGSAEATACNVKWDIARRDTLRCHPWNFAIKRRLVAADTAEPTYQYAYKFTLPAECLRVLHVYNNNEYKLEGRSILTNSVCDPDAPELELKYIYDNTDVSTWDASFCNVMVYRIALELAYMIPGKTGMVDQMAQFYEVFLQKAKTVNASEDIEDDIDGSMPGLMAVRY